MASVFFGSLPSCKPFMKRMASDLKRSASYLLNRSLLMCTNVVNPNHKPATLEDLYHSKFGFVTSIAARLVEQELHE
jgi:hypothetical protein